MAVTLVGSRTTGGANSTGFLTSFGQTPTTGNLLLLTVAFSKATPEPTIALSGAVGATWTFLGKSWASHGAAGGGVYLFAKFATSSETAPTITSTATTTVTWLMEEWSGLDPSYMPTSTTWTPTVVTSASAQVMSASYTSTVAKEWVFGILGGRSSNSGIAPPSAYTGVSADYNTQVARNAYIYTSTGTIATAGDTLSASTTFINNDSTDSNTFALVGFREATVGAAPTVRETLSVSAYSGTSTTVTATTGSGTAVGDLLVAFHGIDTVVGAGSTTLTTPTGTSGTWTAATTTTNVGSGVPMMTVWTRPVTTAGAQTVTVGVSGQDASAHLTVYVLSGVDATTPVPPGGADSALVTGGTTTKAAPSVTGTINGLLLSGWQAGYFSGSSTPLTVPASMSSATATTAQDGVVQRTARETLSVSAATGVRTGTAASSANLFRTASIVLAPAASGPTPEVRTGAGSVTLTGSATSVEVEQSTAPASATLTGTATALAVVPAAGTGSLTLTGSSSSVQVDPRTAAASLALTATATAVPVAPRTGDGSLTLTATAVAVPYGGILTRTGAATVVLTGTATASTDAILTRTGAAGVVLTGTAVATVIHTRTGAAFLNLGGTAATSTPGGIYTRTGAGFVTLGADAQATTVHPRTGTADLYLGQTNIAVAVAVEVRTGTADLTLAPTADTTVIERREGTATLTLAATGRTGDLRDVTVLSVTGRQRVVTVTEHQRSVTATQHTRTVRIEERP